MLNFDSFDTKLGIINDMYGRTVMLSVFDFFKKHYYLIQTNIKFFFVLFVLLLLYTQFLPYFFLLSCIEFQSRPGGVLQQDGEDRKGLFWRSLQRNWQTDSESGGYKNHWFRGSRRWHWRHSTGNHSTEPMRQSIHHQVLWILFEGRLWPYTLTYWWAILFFFIFV